MRAMTTIILALAALLSACGQKGPLVLQAAPVAPQPAAAPTEVPFPGVPATTDKR
jgi:predicted small lipoprotein YifL